MYCADKLESAGVVGAAANLVVLALSLRRGQHLHYNSSSSSISSSNISINTTNINTVT